jgi:tetratricopeptide (TPR) repeat protein
VRPLLLAAVLLAAAVPWTQGRIDARWGTHRAQEEVLYLWSGEQVRRLAPGFEDLMADVYWLRTVQYFGGQRVYAAHKRFELLLPLTDITVTLDPRMQIAYRYGATFLAEAYPIGAGKPQAAVKLLERGVRNLPHDWRLREDLGLFHYYFLNDPHRAAEILQEASRIPGSAPFLVTLAASVLMKAGDRETSRQMWRSIYEQGEGPMRDNAGIHLAQLDALDALEKVNEAIATHERLNGARPISLEELRRAGYRGPLVDPVGVPFAYDRREGRARLAPSSTLWRPELR